MRRMLDQKELGGNLYCHRIKLTNRSNNMITLNYFNNSDVPFTRDSFTKKLVDHDLPCSGSISSSVSGTKLRQIAAYLYFNSNKSISCYAIDLDINNYKNVNLDTYNFYDDVVPA